MTSLTLLTRVLSFAVTEPQADAVAQSILFLFHRRSRPGYQHPVAVAPHSVIRGALIITASP